MKDPAVQADREHPPRDARGVRVVAGFVAAAVLGLTAFALAASQTSARRDLEARFRLRAELGSGFASSFVHEVVEREISSAHRFLAGDPVPHERVDQVTRTFGFEASVVLDRRGAFISGSPMDESLVGRVLIDQYEHLRRAVEEREFGISNVVPSAAQGIPVVAFAAPFEGDDGPRVFSGAFDITATPLDNYLRSLVPIEGGRAYLLDVAGNIIASNGDPLAVVRTLADERPALARAAVERAEGVFDGDDEPEYFTRVSVPDTPWTLVASAPVRTLFEPVLGPRRWVPWLLFAAFAGLVTTVTLLVVRLAEARREMVAVNAELSRKNEAIERSTRAQRDFQAMASHELRSPLAALTGGIEFLAQRPDMDEQGRAKLLAIASRSGNHLRALVDDLLVLHESDSGVLTVAVVPSDAGALVRVVAEEFDPIRRDAELRLEVEVDTEAPPALIDPKRMRQVLWNLLGNAAKFTDRGGRIELAVRRAPGGDGVAFSVTDNGTGIAPDEIERVFETFFRSASKAKNEIKGTGLGLAIARRLVHAQSGRIEVRSVLGQGTTFTVTVPAAPAPAPQDEPAETRAV